MSKWLSPDFLGYLRIVLLKSKLVHTYDDCAHFWTAVITKPSDDLFRVLQSGYRKFKRTGEYPVLYGGNLVTYYISDQRVAESFPIQWADDSQEYQDI